MSSIDVVRVAKYEPYPKTSPTDYAVGFNITVVGGEKFYTDILVTFAEVSEMSSIEVAEYAWSLLRPSAVERANGLANFANIIGRVIEQREAEQFFPWVQPGGAGDEYSKGDKVSHSGYIWVSNLDGNVWEPGVYGWSIIAVDDSEEGATPNGDEDATPSGDEPDAWVQPEGSHDAYNTGDRVTHLGSIWVSSLDGNVWEPGVYGWELE